MDGADIEALGHRFSQGNQRGIGQPPDLQQQHAEHRPGHQREGEAEPDRARQVVALLDADHLAQFSLPFAAPFVEAVEKIGPQPQHEDRQRPQQHAAGDAHQQVIGQVGVPHPVRQQGDHETEQDQHPQQVVAHRLVIAQQPHCPDQVEDQQEQIDVAQQSGDRLRELVDLQRGVHQVTDQQQLAEQAQAPRQQRRDLGRQARQRLPGRTGVEHHPNHQVDDPVEEQPDQQDIDEIPAPLLDEEAPQGMQREKATESQTQQISIGATHQRQLELAQVALVLGRRMAVQRKLEPALDQQADGQCQSRQYRERQPFRHGPIDAAGDLHELQARLEGLYRVQQTVLDILEQVRTAGKQLAGQLLLLLGESDIDHLVSAQQHQAATGELLGMAEHGLVQALALGRDLLVLAQVLRTEQLEIIGALVDRRLVLVDALLGHLLDELALLLEQLQHIAVEPLSRIGEGFLDHLQLVLGLADAQAQHRVLGPGLENRQHQQQRKRDSVQDSHRGVACSLGRSSHEL